MGAIAGVFPIPHDEQQAAHDTPKWELKELKPWHQQLVSLLAQGIDRQTISAILDCTPEYVSMLSRQPKIIDAIRSLSDFANAQLEAQYSKSVQAIGDTLENGNHKEKMQAARLQMEATKRIGSRTQDEAKLIDSNERLSRLANRLVDLLDANRRPITAEVIPNEEQGTKRTEAEDGDWSERSRDDEGSHQSA